MKTGLPYGVINCNSNQTVRCVFCGTTITKTDKHIEEHVAGTKHKDNKEKIETEGISFNDIDTVYCKPCNRNLAEDESIIAHMKTEDHANWITTMDELLESEYMDISKYLKTDKSIENIYCFACKTNLVCTMENVQLHVNDFNHRSNVVEMLKPLNAIFRVDNEEEVWCKICDVYIENTVQSIFDHIDDDDDHNVWMDTVQDLIANQEISIVSYLKNEHEHNARCHECNMDIACDIESLRGHVFSLHIN